MMSFFDEEQIIKSYIRSERRDAAKKAVKKSTRKVEREAAERMLKLGKFTLEDIAECVPSLSIEELKKMKAKITQLT